MKKDQKTMVVMAGLALLTATTDAVPLVGKAVGRKVVREVAQEAAERTLAKGAARTMSSALAGASGKTLLGAGAGLGAAVAVPVGTYKLTDGRQSVDKAHAETIRESGKLAKEAVSEHPELACEVLATMNEGSMSPLDRMMRGAERALPWIGGVIGVVSCPFLAGFALKGVVYMRRALVESRRADKVKGGEECAENGIRS